MVDKIIEVLESLLYHNDKDTPLYGVILEECDDVEKLMGEVSSLLK